MDQNCLNFLAFVVAFYDFDLVDHKSQVAMFIERTKYLRLWLQICDNFEIWSQQTSMKN